MAFPPAHFLVGLGAAEVVRAVAPLPRWRARVAGGALAVLPDLDFLPGLLLGHASAYHGTFTHSVTAVAVVALLAGWAWGPRWAALAGATYATHLLVDLLDDRGRTNVLLGWPFTLQRPYAIAPLFPTVPFENGSGLLVAIQSLFRPEALRSLLEQTLVAGAILGVLLLLAAGIRRAPRGREPSASPER